VRVLLARHYLVGGSRVGLLWGTAQLQLHDVSGAKQTARARSLKAEAIYDGDLAVRALQMIHGLVLGQPQQSLSPALAMALVDGRTTEKRRARG
jgi:hypothetical protein